MADHTATEQFFDAWKKQMEEGTQAWAKAVQQGVASPDLLTQWKDFLDQWLAAWDKTLLQVMQTDAFAETVGKRLDQWLSVQAPVRKAAAESMETMLQALGLPSRNQVVGIARQLMELDDRLEDIEARLKPSTAVSNTTRSRTRASAGRRRPKRKKAGRQ
jgi:hypothetical protein